MHPPSSVSCPEIPPDKLINGWEQIRAMMGDEAQSGITDDEIKDTLYHYYFDVQQSINWLYGNPLLSPIAMRF